MNLETFYLAIEAIKVNKLRSSLTALGVIIGVSAIILLISISSGLQRYVSGEFEKLGANSLFIVPGKFRFTGGGPPRAVNKITFKIAEAIEKEKGGVIGEVLPFLEIDVTANYRGKSKITTLFGTKTAYFDLAGLGVGLGGK